MSIKAGRFFRAGTRGQGFFKAETGSDARINRSYADLFKGTAPEPDDSGGLGMPPTAEEGRELMEWDASPENQRHRLSDLMPMSHIIEASEGVQRQTIRGWIGDRGPARTTGGGAPSRPPFPESVSPPEWGSGAQPNRNRLWKRAEVKQWMDTQQVSGQSTPGLFGPRGAEYADARPAHPDKRPVPPPITTSTVGNLLSNMDERFKAEGGSLPTEGSKDEHGNWRDDK
jgi:hypothetical protein